MTRRIVVVGGGAAGMGAAGGIKAVDPGCEVTVYTGFDDVAYSPCGIPYVHGKEIDSFERLFLASKQAYVDAGIDVHYNADVTEGRRESQGGRGRRGGRGLLGHPGARDRVQLRGPWRSRWGPRGPLLREEHPRGHRMGQGPRHGQVGGRGRGVATRGGDGDGARAPRHRDPPGRSESVADVGDRRSRHHGAGRGVVARARGHDALQHHAGGLRRRRPGAGGADLRRRDQGRPRGGLHPQGAEQRPRASRPASRSAPRAASSSTSGWRPPRPGCSRPATAPRSRTG